MNIAPVGGENGYFRMVFTLPVGFADAVLSGAANVDDYGRAFLNGHPISPPLGSGISEYGNAAFGTQDALLFQSGENVILISDANTGGGPSGGAFYAIVTFTPEPATLSLLALGGLAILRRRGRK